MTTAEIRKRADTRRSRDRLGWFGLVLLLAVALGLNVWVANRAESLVYDSSVFIRYAKELSDTTGWTDADSLASNGESSVPNSYFSVIARHDQHPGYPILIERTHALLTTWWTEADSPGAWVGSARGVSIAGYLALLVAVFVWVRGMMDPWSALMAATAVAASPPLVGTSANGLSDSPALACLVISSHFACRLLRKPSIVDACLAGLTAGVGYLIRPEAMQVALIVCAALGIQFLLRPGHRLRSLTCLTSLGIAMAVCVLPYMALRGSPLTKKAHLVTSLFTEQTTSQGKQTDSLPWNQPTEYELFAKDYFGSPLARPSESVSLTDWDQKYPRHSLETGLSWQRYVRGLYLYMAHLSASLGFVFAVPAFVGFLSLLPLATKRWDVGIVYATIGMNALLLPLVLYCLSGYVGSRHVMSAFVLVAGFVGPGSLLLCQAIRGTISHVKQWVVGSPVRWPVSAKSATVVFVLGSAMILAFVSSSYRLNADLAGCDKAGQWLRDHVNQKGVLFDLIYLPSFYADMEKQNRWHHPGWCSFVALEAEIRSVGRPVYLVVSDAIVKNITGENHISSTLSHFHCDERAAIPLGAAGRETGFVRVFYVTPRLADAERSQAR